MIPYKNSCNCLNEYTMEIIYCSINSGYLVYAGAMISDFFSSTYFPDFSTFVIF